MWQETALNHVGMSTFVGDGMGTTHAMMRHRLIWVVTRMHVEVNRYPVWGDVVEIDSWVAAEGKNGMRRDFLVRDITTGEVISRATRCVAHLLTCLLLGFAPKFSAFCCSVENQVYNQFEKK
jgi:fatty acyl-ACP thioesterase B